MSTIQVGIDEDQKTVVLILQAGKQVIEINIEREAAEELIKSIRRALDES